jgi:hypothetical protein
MVWYNLGLVYEQWAASEPSRAAFARALALRQSRAAADKLGSRSRCTAEIYLGADALDRRVPCRASGEAGYGTCQPVVYYEQVKATSHAAHGWIEVARRMGHEVKTDQAARAVACDFAMRTPGEPEEGRPPVACDGDSPWRVSLGVPSYKLMCAFFTPTGGSDFFFDAWMDGGWGVECEPSTSTEYEIRGAVAIRDTTTETRSTNPETELEYPDPRRCWEGPTMHERTLFSLKTKLPVVRIRSFDSHPEPTVSIDESGTRVTLSGANCSRAIEL